MAAGWTEQEARAANVHDLGGGGARELIGGLDDTMPTKRPSAAWVTFSLKNVTHTQGLRAG